MDFIDKSQFCHFFLYNFLHFLRLLETFDKILDNNSLKSWGCPFFGVFNKFNFRGLAIGGRGIP